MYPRQCSVILLIIFFVNNTENKTAQPNSFDYSTENDFFLSKAITDVHLCVFSVEFSVLNTLFIFNFDFITFFLLDLIKKKTITIARTPMM